MTIINRNRNLMGSLLFVFLSTIYTTAAARVPKMQIYKSGWDCIRKPESNLIRLNTPSQRYRDRR